MTGSDFEKIKKAARRTKALPPQVNSATPPPGGDTRDYTDVHNTHLSVIGRATKKQRQAQTQQTEHIKI